MPPHLVSSPCVFAGQIKPYVNSFPNQVNLFQPRSIWFFFCFCTKKIFFYTFHLLFILLLLFISTLLTSPTIPSLLSQHPSPYSFYLNAYLVSLDLWFSSGFMSWCLTSEPWRLGCKFHYFFNYICIVVVINFLKLFKSDMYVGPSPSQSWKQTWQ